MPGHSRSMTGAPPLPKVAETAAPLDVAQVHEEHADFVWRSLQRLGVASQDLEDLLQEVFIVVHKKLATFNHSARVTTWLFGICLRVASTHRRSARRRYEHVGLPARDTADSGARTNPESALAERQALVRLEIALGAMTLERRAVFVMFEIEGISAPVIAETLGVPVGTVYSRLSTARAEFSESLARLERRDTQRGAR